MADLENNMVDSLTGSLSLVKNTNLFAGEVKDISGLVPDFAIFCRGLGGASADRVFQLTYEVAKPQVAVYVRSNANAPQAAKEKMQAIYNRLKTTIPTGYMDCRCLQSEPQNLGEDDKGRYIFTMTFECWRKDTR